MKEASKPMYYNNDTLSIMLIYLNEFLSYLALELVEFLLTEKCEVLWIRD